MSKFSEVLQRHNQIVAELEAKKKQLFSEVRDSLKDGFKDFFDLVPEVKSVVWTQYTPYFNDGDECVFRVNDYEVSSLEDPDYEYGEGGFNLNKPSEDYFKAVAAGKAKSWQKSTVDSWNEHVKEVGGEDKINKILEATEILDKIFDLPDDFFKDTFGNHVKVVAVPGDFKIDDYEHD